MMVNVTDIAWLAGAIEADGSVGMGFHTSKLAGNRMGFSAKPMVTFSNQDDLFLFKAAEIIRELINRDPAIKTSRSSYVSGNQTYTLVVVGQPYVLALLKALLPFMHSSKKARAELVIRFIESRASKTRLVGRGSGNPQYDKDELGMIVDFYTFAKRKGGKRNERVGPIIQSYLEKDQSNGC
jgi:hypothetical protein